MRVGEQVFQFGNELQQLLMLLFDLLALQARQAPELHVQHGLRLDLCQVERLGHQGVLGLVGGLGGPDRLDHCVQLVQRLDQALQDVVALLGFPEVKLRPPANHLAAEDDVLLERHLEVDHPRLAVNQREHVHRERAPHGGVLVQGIQHRLRLARPAQLDHDAHAVAVGLVAQVTDAIDLLVADQARDALHKRCFVHLERQLRHDDLHPVTARRFFNMRPGLHHNAASAVAVRLLHGVAQHFRAVAVRVVLLLASHAVDDAARREVRSLHDFGQLVSRRLRRVKQLDDRVADLVEVMWGDVGRHAYSDAAGAVYQQVWEPSGEHDWFACTVVEVRHEVDRLPVDVRQHFCRDHRQPRLCVTHGGRWVAVNASEVSLGVNERVTQRPVLGHADHRVIDGRVAVRVVALHHLADHTDGLSIASTGADPLLVERVQDPALDWLKAVLGRGKRARDDHAHRVVEIRRAHLFFDLHRPDRSDVAVAVRGHRLVSPNLWALFAPAHFIHTYWVFEPA